MAERIIYIVRNGHAGNESDGPSEAFRPLSDRGHREAVELGQRLRGVLPRDPSYIFREPSRRSQLSAQCAIGQAGYSMSIQGLPLLKHSGKTIGQTNIDVYRAMLGGDLPSDDHVQVVVIFMSRRAILAALQDPMKEMIHREQIESYLKLEIPTDEEVDRLPPHDTSIVPTMSVTRVRLDCATGALVLDYYGLTASEALDWQVRQTTSRGHR